MGMLPYSYYAVGTMVVLLWIGASQSPATADGHTSIGTKGISRKALVSQAEGGRQNMNLSDYIWEESLDLLPKAWNTTFISGVASGLLNPNFYAAYTLQDAVYCRRTGQLWEQLANNASVNQEVRQYANGSIDGFQSCSIELFDRWNVKDDRRDNYGIIIREPVMDYVSFMENAMVVYAPNMLIASYACLKLWHNLTSELLPIAGNTSTNPYAVWVLENYGSGSSMRRQAAQMDEWDIKYQWYNWSEARNIYRSAMLNEINFFGNGGNLPT